MKNLKKYLAFALALVMLLSSGLVTALAEAGSTAKILTAVTGGKDEEEMKLFAEASSKGTGLDIQMEKPAANYGEVLMNKLNAGEQYDLIYVSLQQLYDMKNDEIITDLTDYIKASPILSDPEVIPEKEWEQLTIDGRIWGGFNKTEVHRVPVVNKPVADKAGVDLAKVEPTLDGYYELFKQLQAAGGEGFYAYNTHIPGLFDLQPWFASVDLRLGFAKREDGSLYVPIATEAAIPVWEWLAKLYKEGLMDPDALINTTGDMRNKMMAGKTGLVVDWAAWVGLYNTRAPENFPNIIEAFPLGGTKNSLGEYSLMRGDPSIWAVPVNAANPQGAIKALEYMATQEGGVLLSIGIEGHDWVMKDGKAVLTEIGATHGMDHGAPVPASRKFVNPIGWSAPHIEEAMAYLPYASLELSNAMTGTYKEIVPKYATEIITGVKTAQQGVAAMDEELKARGVI